MSVNIFGIYEAAIRSNKLDKEQLEFCIKQVLQSPETCLRIIKYSGTHRSDYSNIVSIIESILKNKKTKKDFISSKTAIAHINIHIYDIILNLLNYDETIIFLDNVYNNKIHWFNLFIENYYEYLNEEKKSILDTYLTTKKIINSELILKK